MAGSLVYFLFAKEVQRLKIGLSSARSIRNRVSNLHTASPCHLRIVHYVPGDANLEQELHDELRRFRFSYEWSCYCPGVLLGIRGILTRDPSFNGPLFAARFPAPIIKDDDADVVCIDNARYAHPSLKSKLLSGETLL